MNSEKRGPSQVRLRSQKIARPPTARSDQGLQDACRFPRTGSHGCVESSAPDRRILSNAPGSALWGQPRSGAGGAGTPATWTPRGNLGGLGAP